PCKQFSSVPWLDIREMDHATAVNDLEDGRILRLWRILFFLFRRCRHGRRWHRYRVRFLSIKSPDLTNVIGCFWDRGYPAQSFDKIFTSVVRSKREIEIAVELL